MTLALGVDTGGTYTDAVLIRDEAEVIASAKALTTRHDLAEGIAAAVRAVLQASGVDPRQISLASLSTTLATNALVEGQGGRVALIYIGFAAEDLARHGLEEALKGDPVLVMAGGHSHSGEEAAPLDLQALDAFLYDHGTSVSGFAVASLFATRNPAHEQVVAAHIRKVVDRPVTCSHHLSAKLNGPKRAVTAVLNARLIGMIDGLINRAETCLQALGIRAPMMVVRGDGALMQGAEARRRPIETILSGPAASVVGARWLTGCETALVSDIGGTTTDVALICGGRPAIDPAGATVGGFNTMVEAVAMRTTGLGGDSQVHAVTSGLQGGVTLGPRRVLPIALVAKAAPDVVHGALDRALNVPILGEYDGMFAKAALTGGVDGLTPREMAVFDRIGTDVVPLGRVLRTRLDQSALQKLIARGLVQIASVTPSDAAHLLGRTSEWDGAAAEKALAVMARRRIGSGARLAPDAETLSQMIVDQLTRQTAQALLEAAFAEEAAVFGQTPAELAQHILVQKGLSKHRGILAFDAGLNVDVVGLGASAACYYPAVGRHLNCKMILPEHAGVANAIGAVVGRLTERRSGTVSVLSEGVYRAHIAERPQDFTSSEAALAALETALSLEVKAALGGQGVSDVTISPVRDIRTAEVENQVVFVEATVTVEATARPRVASDAG
ncbi:hydantoinase/oxoprolinase family protein [Epibacterium ulvae]|uniref:hydantoinase/oxoprolinase family protein n=1 Tax=Epibacterium ulvae TaxID=1156985 RepID=UPI002492617F|nr:hydantoinase/oxoprolinase family protein [Epibacterium ulvae]